MRQVRLLVALVLLCVLATGMTFADMYIPPDGVSFDVELSAETFTPAEGVTVVKEAPVNTAADVKFTVNGRPVTLSTAPVIKEGRTYLPLRAVCTHFDSPVSYDARYNVIRVGNWYGQGAMIDLNKKAYSMFVFYPEKTKLTYAPLNINGTTYFALKDIQEFADITPVWNGDTRTIDLTGDESNPNGAPDDDTMVSFADSTDQRLFKFWLTYASDSEVDLNKFMGNSGN